MDREKDLPYCANYAFCGNKISWRSSRQQKAEIRICAGSLECKRFQQRTNRSRKIKEKNEKMSRLEEEVQAIKSVLINTTDENVSKQALACNVLQSLCSNSVIPNAAELKTTKVALLKTTKAVLDLPVVREKIKTQFMCIRSKACAFTFIRNYLERNKNAMFERFLPITDLSKIASYSLLPNLLNDVLSSKIIQLPEKVKVLFCSSGDSEINAFKDQEPLKKKRKTSEEKDLKPGVMMMAQSALNSTPFYNQYAPKDNECLKHHLAGRVISCKVSLLSAFIKQRGTTPPSVLEMAFARENCVVMWGVPKFDIPQPLPSFTREKRLRKYTREELIDELKAQGCTPAQLVRLTTNHARIGYLDCLLTGRDDNIFRPNITVIESLQLRMNEFDNNSICEPGGWIESEIGETFIAPYIK